MAHDVLRIALGLSNVEYRDLLDDMLSRLNDTSLTAIDECIDDIVRDKLKEKLNKKIKERIGGLKAEANEIVAESLRKITRPTQYTIVESTDRYRLTELVSDYISQKWFPHGSLVIVPSDGSLYYYQAMVTYEK